MIDRKAYAELSEYVDRVYLESVEKDLIDECIKKFPTLSAETIKGYIQIEAFGKFRSCWSF